MTFIVGCILFFPRFGKYAELGAWTFFCGSLLYLVVTGHHMIEIRRYWRTKSDHARYTAFEYFAAASYLLGTILFTVGSLFFLSTVGRYHAGAWCFILGSMLFVAGAGINVLQVVKSSSPVTL